MMAVMFGFATSAVAQDKKDTGFKVVDNVKETEVTRQAKLGMDLVQYGYQYESAISLVQAAEIFAKYPIVPLVVKDEEGKAIATEAPIHSYEPMALIKDAKAFAQKDTNLLAYVGNMEENIAKSLATKGETTLAGSSATISLGPGRSKTITVDATPFSINCIEARSNNYADLDMDVWTSMEEKGSDYGTNPTVYFFLGLCSRVYVYLENTENYSTTVELFYYSVDPDDLE